MAFPFSLGTILADIYNEIIWKWDHLLKNPFQFRKKPYYVQITILKMYKKPLERELAEEKLDF